MMQRLLLRSAGLLLVLLSTLSPALAQEHRAAIDRALAHARANATELGVTARDATSLTVSDAYPSRHTGVTHVYLQQAHQGIPVHNAILSTAVRSDGTIAHTSGRLIADLGAKITGTAPGLSPEAAVEAAARHLGIAPTGSLEVLERSGSGVRRTLLSPAGLSRQPIEARLTYQPLKSGEVRLAWQVTIEMVREPHWWQIRLDAATGEVLDQNDLVDHDTWGTPATAAATGHRTAPPADARSASPPSAGSSALMPDSYRVYPFPFESPQHGATHVIVTNPINDAPAGTYPGSTTSWHDTDDDGTAQLSRVDS